jgi:hypothetical protein
MLGAPAAAPAFKVLSPVDRVLVDDRVGFKWEPVEDAKTYRVTIYDSGYGKIAESPAIATTNWQLSAPLPRGAMYTWTVTAQKQNGVVRAPAPPQPEAAFKIVSEDEAAKISDVLRDHPADHLLLAILYAHAGVLDEAQAQLDQLAGANPNNRLVGQFKASLAQAKTPSQAASPMNTKPAQ